MNVCAWRRTAVAMLAMLVVGCQHGQGPTQPSRFTSYGTSTFPGVAKDGTEPGVFYDDGSDADSREAPGLGASPTKLPFDLGAGGWDDPAAAPGNAANAPLPPCRPGADELWVFAEDARTAPPARRDGPRSGQMVGRSAAGTVIDLPLQHTDVRANVCGYLSAVDVTQHFVNPYAEKIEAVYVFPLPDDAAVRDFMLVIGDRQIRGIIRKRAEAARIYEAARSQGYRAALLEQARPNIFEQAVANLEPGKAIDVRLRYVHTLAYAQGSYEFVFPMVVGPRYDPPGWRNGVGAVAAQETGSSGQPAEVAYLPPGVQATQDVDVTVDIDGGMPIGQIGSPSHTVDVARPTANRARVQLTHAAPDRDFVLRMQVGGTGCRAGLVAQADGDGGYLTLMLHPPDELRELPRQPLELVFVLDCSGSMEGAPLAKAKAAVELALRGLGEGDTLQLIRFGDSAELFAPAPVPATAENLERAREWLRVLRAGGGTEMLSGMRAALDGTRDPRRLRFVAFLTDGFIGNESEVFAAVRERIGTSRIFSLGIGSSVNRYLLEGIARLGRGAAGFLLHDEAPGRAVAQLYERIAHPALTDVQLDWDGAAVADVFPARLPDLFAGRPVVVNARYRGAPPQHVRVHGRVAGHEVTFDAVTTVADTFASGALSAAWARRKIQSLADYAEVEGHAAAPQQIEALALAHNLMSPFTSFVAVDASERTAGDHGWTMPVPVPMPAGVRYDTTVPGR